MAFKEHKNMNDTIKEPTIGEVLESLQKNALTKEDKQFLELVKIMKRKNLLTDAEVKEIFSL
ncbi:MAG: hypothetical protein Q8M83_03150 [bacterium]|nr:hypothetical protein [bacterium]